MPALVLHSLDFPLTSPRLSPVFVQLMFPILLMSLFLWVRSILKFLPTVWWITCNWSLTCSACLESRPIPSTWKRVLATPMVGISVRTPRWHAIPNPTNSRYQVCCENSNKSKQFIFCQKFLSTYLFGV